MNLLKLVRPKSKLDQATRILRAIKKSGSRGVANYELSRISLKYSSRITELRKDGHNIYAERQVVNGRCTGTWKYYLNED